jgi:polyphenol oxidase
VLRRRSLLTGAAAAAGVLASRSDASGVAVRQDAATLPQSLQLLHDLEAAISEMQDRSARDPRDPKGWVAHMRAHDLVCAAVNNSDAAQVHGCWWFLPWHRAFLAVTEWKLRALSGNPSLALPYWDWSSDRTIPAAFVRPGSPLARAVRHTPARPLTSVEVDHLLHDEALAVAGVAALRSRAFRAWTPEQIPHCFGGVASPNANRWHGRSRLETVPHNAVHNYVGGEAADGSLGDMTELATAALDPVFYAHHANIDRLWEAWRSDPLHRASEPADPEFLERRFLFPWLDGTVITLSVADTLDTHRLGYAYDRLEVFRAGAPSALPGRPDLSGAVLTAALAVPRPGEDRRSLRVAGVLPGERPVSVAIALARTGEPASAITVGACAIGRRHSTPSYPDTELHFDVEAALHRLGASSVTAAVLPLSLGPGSYRPPSFIHAGMSITAMPT